MRIGVTTGKRRTPFYPRLSRLPAAFHDVADFAHPPDIGIADALAVRAPVAIGKEPVAATLKGGALIR
jgi:hypothetical protein